MAGNLNNDDKVVCCFCGKSLPLKDAVILAVQTNVDNQEIQQLFCHKKHFVEKIDKTIVLHPDLKNSINE